MFQSPIVEGLAVASYCASGHTVGSFLQGVAHCRVLPSGDPLPLPLTSVSGHWKEASQLSSGRLQPLTISPQGDADFQAENHSWGLCPLAFDVYSGPHLIMPEPRCPQQWRSPVPTDNTRISSSPVIEGAQCHGRIFCPHSPTKDTACYGASKVTKALLAMHSLLTEGTSSAC